MVIDHVAQRVVWARPGKDAATLGEFFKELGPERCKQLEAVTIDMSAAYIKAVTEASPSGDDDLRPLPRPAARPRRGRRGPCRAEREVRDSRGTEGGQGPQAYALHPAQEPLEPDQPRGREARPVAAHQQAHLPRRHDEGRARRHPRRARRRCRAASSSATGFHGWAARSRSLLEPFKKLARTVKEHFEGILAYIPLRLNNGRTEGMNGKIRTITRRSYGFHSASNLIALIFPLLLWDLPAARAQVRPDQDGGDVHSLRRRTSRAARDRRRAVLRWPAGALRLRLAQRRLDRLSRGKERGRKVSGRPRGAPSCSTVGHLVALSRYAPTKRVGEPEIRPYVRRSRWSPGCCLQR